MTPKKCIGIALGALGGTAVLAAGAAGFLLFTTPGLELAARTAVKCVPGLSIGGIEGRIDRLTITDFAYEMPGVTVAAKRLHTAVDLAALFNSFARIEAVDVSGLSLDVDTSAMVPSEPAPEEESAPLALELPAPWRFAVERLSLEDADIIADGNRVAWGSFTTGAAWSGRALQLTPTVLEDVRLTLAKAAEAPASSASSPPSEATQTQEPEAAQASQEAQEPQATKAPASTEVAANHVSEGAAANAAEKAPAAAAEASSSPEKAASETASASAPASEPTAVAESKPASSSSSASQDSGFTFTGRDEAEAPVYSGKFEAPKPRGIEKSIAEVLDETFANPLIEALPTVELPLDVAIEDLSIRNIRWTNAADFGVPTSDVSRIHLRASTLGSTVIVQTAEIASPEGNLAFEGEVRLADAWPLDLRLAVGMDAERVASLVPALRPYFESNRPAGEGALSDSVELRATLSGALLERLGFDLTLKNLLAQPFMVSGDAALAEPKLPLRLDLSLPALTVPMPQSAEGTAANASNAETADQPTAVAAADNAKAPAAPAPATPTKPSESAANSKASAHSDAPAPAATTIATSANPADAGNATDADGIADPGQPLPGDRVTVRDLRVLLSGDTDDYRLDVSTSVRAELAGSGLAAPAGVDLELRGNGNLNGIRLESLAARFTEGGSGAVKLAGGVEWRRGFVWRGKLETNPEGIDARALVPAAPTYVRGSVDSIFTGNKTGVWRATLSNVKIDGKFGDAILETDGGVWMAHDRSAGFNNFRVRLGKNTLRLDGALQGVRAFDLRAEVDAPGFENTIQGLRGRAKGFVKLLGTGARPIVDADFTADDLGWQDLSVGKVVLKGKLRNQISEKVMREVIANAKAAKAEHERQMAEREARGESTEGLSSRDAAVAAALETALAKGELSGEISLAVDELAMGEGVNYPKIRLLTKGRETNHRVTLTVEGEPVSGSLTVKGAVNRRTFDWKGSLEGADIRTPAGVWKQAQAMGINYTHATKDIRLGAHCWSHQFGEVCLAKTANLRNAGERGAVEVVLKKLDLGLLKPYLPKKRDTIEGVATGNLKASWNLASGTLPDVDLLFELPKLDYRTRIDGARFPVSIEDVRVTGRVRKDAAEVRWHLVPSEGAVVDGRIGVADPLGARTLTGRVRATNVTPVTLKPLLSRGEKAEGRLDADLTASGTLEHPEIRGRAAFTGLNVDAAMLPLTMEPSDVVFTFLGTSSVLEGALNTKDGNLIVRGSADWSSPADWRARVSAKMSDDKGVLRIAVPPMVTLSAVPDIEARASAERVTLTGRIVIPDARIEVESIPESAVKVSSDAVMLDENLQPKLAPEPPIPFESRVAVELKRALIDAFGLKAALNGELQAVQDPKHGLGLSGQINIPAGRFRAYGQDLMIRRGTVLFAGPVDNPSLSIEAIRNPETTADDVTAGIRVTGTAAKPEVTLFSDPAKSQEETLSYLLRGEGLGTLGEGEGNMMTSMLLALGTSTGSPVLGAIGDSVGISNLGIDTTGVGDNSQVVVSGYVLPGLQVKYGIGIFDSLATLTLRYRLMPRLYLEAVSGVDQAIDFLYRFDF